MIFNVFKLMSLWGVLLIVLYHILYQFGFGSAIIFSPIILFLLLDNIGIKHNYIIPKQTNLYVSLGLLLIIFFSEKCDVISTIYHENIISFAPVLIFEYFILSIIIDLKEGNKLSKNDNSTSEEQDLFNLLYINFSKTIEIAMLIDNKIKNKIENEISYEEIAKKTNTFAFRNDTVNLNTSAEFEDSLNQRIYEDFDVKNTKSTILRILYSQLLEIDGNPENQSKIKNGKLVKFKNVELKGRNLDDMLMVLNVLEDSNIKNISDENVQINMNKMIGNILEDFTIDYIFEVKDDSSDKKEEYIIQLPYKSYDNFENGYQHNDLQLGKLSLIGIYRGVIDFSEIDSIYSKLLQFMTNQNNSNNSTDRSLDDIMKMSNHNVDLDDIMKMSNHNVEQELQFDLKYNKLSGKYHLIDIIAIIQELNIEEV